MKAESNPHVAIDSYKNVEVRCRLCGGPAVQREFEVQNWPIERCVSCGLMQLGLSPTAEELSAIYADDYFARGKYLRDRAAEREQERRLSLLVHASVPSGARVLDAGCATGDFLFHAKNMFEMWGIDISSLAVDEAKRINPEIAERISATMLENYSCKEAFFDAVVLWDVIEHIANPVQLLTQIRAFIKPGGALFLSTPNSGSLSARILKSRWAFMTPPEHVCFFDRATMELLFESAGFQLSAWKTRGKWVNLGFLLYKFRKKFPMLLPQAVADFVKESFLGRLLVYVPTGDIQYASARRRDIG